MALKRAVCFEQQETDLSLGGLLGLLGEEDGLDVGEDTALGDGHTGKQLVQLLVVTDGQLEVTGDDPGLLVVTGSVASQLEDLSCQVLHDGGHVDWGSSANTLSIVSLPQKTMDTSNWELKSGPAGPRLCLSLNFSSFAAARHVDCLVSVELLSSAGTSAYLYTVLLAQCSVSTQLSCSLGTAVGQHIPI